MRKILITLFILVIFNSLFLGCKKGIKDDSQVNANEIEKLLTLPTNASFEAKRIKQQLVDEQIKNGFIDKLIKSEGFPVWNKLQIERIKKNTNNFSRGEDSNNSNTDTLILVPLVLQNAENVNSFLAVKLDGNVNIQLFRGRDYDEYPFDKENSTQITAEKIAIELMMMDKDVFGYKDFTISDKRLFSKYLKEKSNTNISDKDILETTVELQNEMETPVAGTAGRFFGWCITFYYNQCDGSDKCFREGKCDALTGGCGAGTCGLVQEELCSGEYGPGSDRGGIRFFNSLNYNFVFGQNGGGGSGTGGLGWNSTKGSKIWAELTQAQKNYLNNNPSIKQDILILARKDNFNDDALAATQITIDALMNNLTNGPYNQNTFDNYVKPYLPNNMQSISYTIFWNYFNYLKNKITIQNPSITQLSIFYKGVLKSIMEEDNINTNEITNPCLRGILQQIESNTCSDDISNLLQQTFGTTDKINIKFVESNTLNANQDAHTIATILPNGEYNIEVQLNINVLPNASKEFTTATIFHEILHNYLLVKGLSGNLNQHIAIANKYLNIFVASLQKNYTNLTLFQAKALAWGGLEDTDAWKALTPQEQYDYTKENTYQHIAVNGTPCN